MNGKTPHIFQYQGSKRILAARILRYMPHKFARLIEPFSGTAAISIATACESRTTQFIINDINIPLINMLQEAVETPSRLIAVYHTVWNEQFRYSKDHVQYFHHIREKFNNSNKTPANMLYF
ncbi:MAG: DNA adenine methylase [Oxalobacter formigenes]|nr:DNA adenine methylase [Oxalobacter formigenes]